MDDLLTGSQINKDIQRQLAAIPTTDKRQERAPMQPGRPIMMPPPNMINQQQAGYGGYPPQAAYGGYPQAYGYQQPAYGGYPPQQPAYGGYPPQQPYGAPQYGGYPPQQPYGAPQYAGYPPQQQMPQQPPPQQAQPPRPPAAPPAARPPVAPTPTPYAPPPAQSYAAPPAQTYGAPPQAGNPPTGDLLAGMDFGGGGAPPGAPQVGSRVVSGASGMSEDIDNDFFDGPSKSTGVGEEYSLELQKPAASDLETYEVVFETERELGMLLERRTEHAPGETKTADPAAESTVVTMVLEGGAASRKDVAVGSRLLAINDKSVEHLPYAKCLDMVKTLPRPLKLLFERSRAALDTAKGWCLICKSIGAAAPSSIGQFKRAYFVVGGAVAKKNVLQLYETKAQYEDIVVRMFQNKGIAGQKYKAYALTSAFKISPVMTKNYKHGELKYFTLKNPYSRTKVIKFGADQNPSVLIALQGHCARYATPG